MHKCKSDKSVNSVKSDTNAQCYIGDRKDLLLFSHIFKGYKVIYSLVNFHFFLDSEEEMCSNADFGSSWIEAR